MKTCSRCKKTLNESLFYRKNKSKEVYHCYCKRCLNDVQMKRWKQRKVDAIKLKGDKCIDCNKSYPPEVYNFHHRNPSEKEFNWDKGRLLSWDRIVKELDKCDLLCANCHVMRHSKDISEYEKK